VDAWTVDDAVSMLSPVLTAAEIRAMIELFAIPPYSSRRTGRRGRPLPTYDSSKLQEAHAVVMRARVDLGGFKAA
jgi:hypothetical protein